ncbi:Spo0E like sporulation regulatory protein [Clostridioides difficile]|nr:Spo0E like sporulation regulatory protein [Clostridioides difficile]CZS07682.1 Spo0E like sporulation regulatory protein [Clostridioides difficile]
MYIKIYKFVIVVIIMANSELEALKNEIEAVREEINTYIEYPEIFQEELVESSKKIDILINKYMYLSK